MDELLKQEIFTISIWQLIALIALVIAFVVLFMKANRTPSLKAYFYVLFTIALWLIGKIFKTVSPTVDIRWSFIVLYYLAICLLEVAFLECGYAYYKGRSFRIKTKVFLYLLPLIQFVVILTNPYHHLFYSKYDFYHDSFGSLFYLHVVIEYVYITIGIVLCAIKLRSQFKYKSKGYKYLLATATLGPIILNILYITRVLQKIFYFISFPIIFDVTPIIFTWSTLLFVYATFKYEFFDLSPIMKHEIVHKLDTPICIIDNSGDVLFFNERLNDRFMFNDNPAELLDMIRANRKQLTSGECEPSFDHLFEHAQNFYIYYAKRINSLGGTKFIIVYNNVTSYVLAREKRSSNHQELRRINQELNEQIEILKNTSKVGARNFVARELHDIIGHSLVVTMKLLEVAKLAHQNQEMVVDSLKKARISLLGGIHEIKQVNRRDSHVYTGHMLKKELQATGRKVKDSGLSMAFYFKGEQYKIDEKVYDIIKRVCTELITNTLKHANAQGMLLSCTIHENLILICYMDDGKGVDQLVKGNGISGIETRLSFVDGHARFSTSKNEGFTANITIPVRS